jgi:hypothetical protein
MFVKVIKRLSHEVLETFPKLGLGWVECVWLRQGRLVAVEQQDLLRSLPTCSILRVGSGANTQRILPIFGTSLQKNLQV